MKTFLPTKVAIVCIVLIIFIASITFISTVLPTQASTGSTIVAEAQQILVGKGAPINGWPGNEFVTYSWSAGHGTNPGPSLGNCKGYTGPLPCNANTTVGVDCSGFTRWVYDLVYKSDVLTSVGTKDQVHVKGLQRVTTSQPGDLVFFASNKPNGAIFHVGIYTGNDQMIDAPHTGVDVRSESVTKFLFNKKHQQVSKVVGYFRYMPNTPPTPTPTTTPPSSSDDWTMIGYDPAGTWNNPNETTISTSNVKQLKNAWKDAVSAPSNIAAGAPVVANGVVYVGSTDYNGNLYAFNATSGNLDWKYSIGAINGSPTVINGVVYVDGNGILYALNAANGTVDWTYTKGIAYSPILVNGVIYAVTGYGVSEFDATTGQKIWTFSSTFGAIEGAPVVSNGVVYITSQDETLYAVNATSGKLDWKYYVGASMIISPTVANGVVYVADEYNSFYAFDAVTGKLSWQYTTNGSSGSISVSNGVVYIISPDLNVYALNANTHALIGKDFVGGEPFTSPSVANGVVYVSSSGMNAIDATTMKTLWTFPLPNSDVFSSSPVVANGMVYAVTESGNLYAFHL